jgi:hypothetical protein
MGGTFIKNQGANSLLPLSQNSLFLHRNFVTPPGQTFITYFPENPPAASVFSHPLKRPPIAGVSKESSFLSPKV